MTKKSFSAPREVATTTASSLEEMLYGVPTELHPMQGKMGIIPSSSTLRTVSTLTLSTTPALWKSMPSMTPIPRGLSPISSPADYCGDAIGGEHGHYPVRHVEGLPSLMNGMASS